MDEEELQQTMNAAWQAVTNTSKLNVVIEAAMDSIIQQYWAGDKGDADFAAVLHAFVEDASQEVATLLKKHTTSLNACLAAHTEANE